jgi:hypothetical protein
MNPFRSRLAAVCAAAVTVACIWLAYARCSSPVHPGNRVERLVSRLEKKGLALHAVPASENGDLGTGVYLCTAPVQREKLGKLLHSSCAVSQWKGVVHVGRCLADDDTLEEGTEVIAACQLFGDPELLASIRHTLGK